MDSIALSCVVCQIDFVHILIGDDTIESLSLCATGICPKCVNLCSYCLKHSVDNNNEPKLCTGCYKNHLAELEAEWVDPESIDDVSEKFDNFMSTQASNNDIVYVDSDSEDDVTDTKKQLCKRIFSIFASTNGGLGSDGNGGSLNGELRDSSCRKIVDALQLNHQDKLLDIGSGGGLTLTKLCAIGGCQAAIGIEVEPIRHDICATFSNAVMLQLPDLNIPVSFTNADVNQLSSFNGITKIYMYDAVFTVQTMRDIAATFNKSITVQFIASTYKDLSIFGFNVETNSLNVGSLAARGSKMSHSFYISKPTGYNDQPSLYGVIDKRIVEMTNVAMNRQIRLQYVSQHMYAIQNSDKSLRTGQVCDILGENRPTSSVKEFGSAAMQLYEILRENSVVVRDTLYNVDVATKSYRSFNVKPLLLQGKSEIGALWHKTSGKALIAPSYDGEVDGCILVAIIHDSCFSKHIAVIYDTSKETFEETSVLDVLNKFNYECSFPFDIQNILDAHRLSYPLLSSSIDSTKTAPRTRTATTKYSEIAIPQIQETQTNSRSRKTSIEVTPSNKRRLPEPKQSSQKAALDKVRERLSAREEELKHFESEMKKKDAEIKKIKEKMASSSVQQLPTQVSTSNIVEAVVSALSVAKSVGTVAMHVEEIVQLKVDVAVKDTKIEDLYAQLAKQEQHRKEIDDLRVEQLAREDVRSARDCSRFDSNLDRDDKRHDSMYSFMLSSMNANKKE